VRFGVQTNLLPDGSAVLLFTAKQDQFIWESGVSFQVRNMATPPNNSDGL
jgi:hypothetical protein